MVRTLIKLSGVLLAHLSCFVVVCALDPITCLFNGLGNGGGSAARARRFKCRCIQLRFSPCLFIVQVQWLFHLQRRESEQYPSSRAATPSLHCLGRPVPPFPEVSTRVNKIHGHNYKYRAISTIEESPPWSRSVESDDS